MKHLVFAAATLGLALAAQPAAAALIFNLDGGTAQTMPVQNRFIQASAPVKFGVNNFVTYRGTTADGRNLTSRFGVNTRYAFGGDRAWGTTPAEDPFVVGGIGNNTFSFTFETPVDAVLAEFNWSPREDNDVFLRAYSSTGALLESYQLAFADPTKTDFSNGFFGVSRARGDIGRIEITGYTIGARSFSTFIDTSTGAVPEPATWAMMIMGFGATGAMVRRRRTALA